MRTTVFLTTASALALGLFLTAETARADDNRMFVEQVGDANFGGGSQSDGARNETWVQQLGNRNSAGASFVGADANANNGLIKQTGNRNVGAWSFQSGPHAMTRNTLGMVQNGNANYAEVNLNQDGPGLTDSTVFVEQNGRSNFFGPEGPVNTTPGNGQFAGSLSNDGVSSADLEEPVGSSFALGLGKIRGDNQFVALEQDGVGNAFAVSMSGSGNEIAGNDGATGKDLQNYTNGGFFSRGVTISAPGDIGSFGVAGIAQQIGNDNVGVVRVEGFNNAAAFVQDGNRNVGEIYQQGNNNNAAVAQ
ncbi:MAG: hypothetical protein GVY33_09855 [Alphaproteobacteria bacterium]|jgi:hypothetical protein|nr:hypothetical protein [Alphaproteobacteria bacterium]